MARSVLAEKYGVKFVLLLIFILLSNSVFAEVNLMAESSLWLQQKFSGKSCDDLKTQDFSGLSAHPSSLRCQTRNRAVITPGEDTNAVRESLFFNSMAEDQMAQFDCEISNINFFEKDEALIKLRAEDAFSKLPFIKEQMQLASQKYADLQQEITKNNVFANYCSQSTKGAREKCYLELETMRKNEKHLEEEWKLHRGMAWAHQASLWNSSTETMTHFFKKLIRQNPPPTQQDIADGLKLQLPNLKLELIKNRAELTNQSTLFQNKRYFNSLNDSTKRQLVEQAVTSGYFSKAAATQDAAQMTLLCRVEGKYTKGRDTLTSTASTATLFLGGFAGMMSKIPLAFRAGQFGSIISNTQRGARVAGALATALDIGVVTSSIQQACFSDKVKLQITRSCPVNKEDYQKSEIKKIAQENCFLTAALAVAPVGFLATSGTLKILQPTLKRYAELVSTEQIDNLNGFFRIDALKNIEKMNQRFGSKPLYTRDTLTLNQQEAEKYFAKSKLKVAEAQGVDTYGQPNYPSSVFLETMAKSFGGKTLKAEEKNRLRSTLDVQKVYKLKDVPKPNPKATGMTAFWENPNFADRFAEMKEMGVDVILDPQKKNGAFYWPNKKAIYVSPDTPFNILEHEFTHAQFDSYLKPFLGSEAIIDGKFRAGSNLIDLLPSETISKVGKSNLEYLQGLMKNYDTNLAVNESLAVKKQLQAIGWRPLDPDYYWTKIYGGYYRVSEILMVEKNGKLSENQKQLLTSELTRMGADAAMMRSFGAAQKLIAQVKKDIGDGKVATALVSWKTLENNLLKKDAKKNEDEYTYFYNTSGDLVRSLKNSSKLEYLNLKSKD